MAVTEGSEGTGGNLVAPLVAVLGASVGMQAVTGIYQFYMNHQRSIENQRYWDDYYRNTGIRPVYPFRAGDYTDYGYVLSAVGTGVNIFDRVGAKNIYG